MSNQGLSIFDHEPDNGGDEPTQVIPTDAAEQAAGNQKTAQKLAEKPVEKPAEKPAERPAAEAPQRAQQPPSQRPAAHPSRPAAAPTNPPAAAQIPSLPTVRRGGYDTSAVDKHLRTLTAEKAGLAASLTEAQARLKALQSEVE